MFNETHASTLICLITSDTQNAPLFRIDITPDADNGLQRASQIMVDKIVAIRRERITDIIGQLDEATMMAFNRSLALVTGIA